MSDENSTQKIKIGDTVRLKSGGPVMTTNGYAGPGGSMKCAWFVGADANEAIFSPAALEHASVEK